MKLALIGVGQAGGTIVDQFAQHDAELEQPIVADAMVVNTSKSDLAALRYLPRERRLLIGQAEVDGHGVGTDNKLATQLMTEDISEVTTLLNSMSLDTVEAFLVIGSLGGGTGSGGAPVIIDTIQSKYDQPVYSTAILPHTSEGTHFALNAARSLKTIEEHADSVILFDNAVYSDDEDLESMYPDINADIITRLGALFSLDELGTKLAFNDDSIQTDELRNALELEGHVTLSYRTDVPREPEDIGIIGKIKQVTPEIPGTEEHVEAVTKMAVQESQSITSNTNRAQKILYLAVVPEGYSSKSVLNRGTEWIRNETLDTEVVGRMYVPEESVAELVALVVFAGVDESQRLRGLTQSGLDALRFGGNVHEPSEEQRMELFMQESPESSDAKIETLF